MNQWNIDKARATYNCHYWSGGYFDINESGEVCAFPTGQDGGQVNLPRLVTELHEQGLKLPVLLRFADVLRHRVNSLCQAFEQAMETEQYQGRYTAVYPIKVNQQRSVIEDILSAREQGVGLEAGSKPELLAVLALSRPGAVVICNGYKDREYIRLALIGRQLGLRIHIVIEKLTELELVIEESRKMGVAPLLGVRVRLASIGAGKWQNSGGEKAKFGLSAAQVLRMVARLQEEQMLDTLQLMHFHMGSQLANVRDIQHAMREVARHYVELRQMGVPLSTVDVGGGLGVDYEGTRSRSFCSMNYSLQEYANNIVHVLAEACQQQQLPVPDIVTESGRAMTAHHAMLITNVIDIERAPDGKGLATLGSEAPSILHDMMNNLAAVREEQSSLMEVYHDAAHWLVEVQSMYSHGVLSLSQRAQAEEIYFATCHEVRSRLRPEVRHHRELLDELNEKLADKVFINLSIFQSMPDVWAIDQIFPIMPLQQLDVEPTRRAILEDITCDSDGRIDEYVDSAGLESSLPVHTIEAGKDYLLGIFLVGAYQEILGDMHNLFGDTDSVNVVLEEEGYRLESAQQGDTVDEVLRYVHIEAEDLMVRFRHKIADCQLAAPEALLAELEAGLNGYTYLEE